MPSSRIPIARASLALLAACTKADAPATAAPISEADAARHADATVAAWTSLDVARIKALYAPAIVGFDYSIGPLATDRATWDKAQDGYAAARFDSPVQQQRKIQILGPDIFVVSGLWDVKSSAIPANNSSVRCTDVYQKDAAGNWPIVHEHCSAVPKPA